MKRPLDDKRPVGPFIDEGSEEESSFGDGLDEVEEAIAEQASSWHESVSDEKLKRKYMRNYIDGITDDDFSFSRIEKIIDQIDI